MTTVWPARAVLIDLDGTLLDTVPDLAAAVNAMLEELGRAALSVSTVAAYIGKGADILVHRALAGDSTAVLTQRCLRAARKRSTGIPPPQRSRGPGFFPVCLPRWRRPGGRAETRLCHQQAARVHDRPARTRRIAGLFDAVISGDDTTEKKPHAAPVLAGMRPAECRSGRRHHDR